MWSAQKVVTVIHTMEDIDGISLTSGCTVVATIIRNQLACLFTSRDCRAIDTLWEPIFRAIFPNDRSGFAMVAIAGINAALRHLKAALTAKPLADLLGGAPPEPFVAYVSTTNPGGFQPSHIRWFQDPLPPADIEAYMTPHDRGGADLPLALSNFCFNRWDCGALLSEGVVDVLQPDIAWAGDVTETLRILDMADADRVPVILHNTSEQPWALATSSASPLITEVEYVDCDADSMPHELFEGGPAVKKGRGDLDPGTLGQKISPQVAQSLIPF